MLVVIFLLWYIVAFHGAEFTQPQNNRTLENHTANLKRGLGNPPGALGSLDCSLDEHLAVSSFTCEGVEYKRFNIENCKRVLYETKKILEVEELGIALTSLVNGKRYIDIFVKEEATDTACKSFNADNITVHIHTIRDENSSNESLCEHLWVEDERSAFIEAPPEEFRDAISDLITLDISKHDDSVQVFTRTLLQVKRHFYLVFHPAEIFQFKLYKNFTSMQRREQDW
ncbi:signal peptide containing protein [Theileria equi strain WA]|uniref:Signal peptide containing protein n=1 Tax=Theileria equi strain WA TaxID=1537102 RepID=L1LDL9_THEEQ|nr:signal peptide containing protein [Theileria equi strain WA]EKX73547.1 signal peptide containing protein [Theileria equi strain WA]|eukprot:XP_004832999.1 signal peptide containing protein [Theileria equi strain WA]